MTQPSGEVRAREPKPRPLAIAVMAVAILGGSCTLQTMLAGEVEPPSEAQIEKTLERMGPLAQLHGEQERERMVKALQEFAVQQVRVAAQLQPFHVGFGIFLLASYAFSFLFGLRTLSLAREAPSQLSLASLFVLISRVAVAAIDVAQAQKLRPAVSAFARLTPPPSGLPPEETASMIAAASNALSWTAVAFEMGRAIAVCALFTAAWRYFQRPDVVAFFERHSPADPLE